MPKYHAYYIEEPMSTFGAYKNLIKPFWASKFERFGVDDARELIALANLKNFANAAFLVGAVSITSEAQQALLKLFEEPQSGTTFILLLPHGLLLSTLKSRMLEYPKIQITNNKSQTIEKFLKSNQKERSDFITKLLKDEEGLKERVRDFINALEIELSKNIKKNKDVLVDVAMVRDYLGDKAPSLKMLLEHLALSLPTV